MTRLSASLHEAADADAVELDLDAVHARVGVRRRRRTRLRLAGGAVGALALVGGLAVAVAAGSSDGTDVRAEAPADPADPGPEGTSPVTEPTETSTSDPTTTTEPPATSTSTSTTSTTAPATTTEPPPTSTTAPPPTTTPPPTTAPSSYRLTWTYEGLEQYRLSQPQCPDITHWIDADAVASDGSSWTLREDYCGTHHGSQWSGEGTFSLTAADGSSLTGRTESSAPAGTTGGVPYTFFVDGGTGPYAGMTGACVVTTTMSDQVFGSQRHQGTISCEIGLAGAPGSASSDGVPESV